ncbi:helix-turn-helix domain-containing protein [Ruminococcus sp. OA3]|nr:helix-turn-helix transcriptional regulator [Ruminococcus sp. OA3]MCH1984192.1 helix-turn-helix domain-containing protein [Ruminococcus sp. OA3]
MKILLGDIMYKNNLTTRQVSIMTGIPKSTINKIVNGKVSPRLDTLEAIAQGLNVRISDLYESNYK